MSKDGHTKSGRARTLSYTAIGAGSLLVVVVVIGYAMLFFAPERLRFITNILLPTIMLLGLIAVSSLVVLAIHLWRAHSPALTQADEVRAGLAIALGTGVAIALGILILQFGVQAVSDQRDLRAERESIRFTIGASPDLTGFVAPRDPGDPDQLLNMTGYWFRGKDLTYATLNEATLRGANFVFTDLDGAHMRSVDLTANDGQKSDFRAANLRWADLTDTAVGDASFVDADLSRVYLCGVDLTHANLTRADLREAKLDEDPLDGACEVPGTLPDVKPEGACWPDEDPAEERACGREARVVAAEKKD